MTFAYFSILILSLLNAFCAAYAKKLAHFTPANNHYPRDFMAKATGKAARLNAAQNNGYEVLPIYAAAVIIAHATGEARQDAINFWAFAFLALRVAFIWAYANDKSTLRSIIWGLGYLCIIALFIAAC
ncbi:MAPEG family protein [Kingella negevensis]|uniref:MAPEG family protein n=1 Tax=Kingella negevensis TaxID=1522312 RepID=UPI00050A17C4|nr:MAPEG family protein [Kingella negevensis]MDK4680706.1 MAPEG family protein [Kingella negevensis]MDK4681570.1 MAPEG family protein [Kingella negevensis]MDK4683654.1 MAPEG family protein [Kingella negevensis]MDK4687776.1 MAPEG family protein [Kingella negevensis]MDK4691958.1 MAPEG family protein [Kingella negevensis]